MAGTNGIPAALLRVRAKQAQDARQLAEDGSDADESGGSAVRADNAQAADLGGVSGFAERQPPPSSMSSAKTAADPRTYSDEQKQPSPTTSDTIANGHDTQDVQHRRWQLALSDYVKHDLSIKENEMVRSLGLDRATYREWALGDVRSLPERRPEWLHLKPPAFLSATEVEEDIQVVIDAYLPARREDAEYEAGIVPATSRVTCLDIEDPQAMAVANAEYLARPEVIERLGYSQSMALMVGGKHHGKTTHIRTLALSVGRGLPIWGRKTTQGNVLYVASDDEVASTRNELLQMGITQADPVRFGKLKHDSDATPQQRIEDIADWAMRLKATLIILDMLFDFVGIQNELSYQETRQELGRVQWLADETKALVVGCHHTPKYLTDAHNATNAALGSQGVSARFSPIIFARKWADSLYTVESTMTRDPRGLELKAIKVVRNAQGWIEVAGEFKEWMKWEMYAVKVMAIFEGGDPGEGQTVQGVASKLEIDRARAQNTLYQLQKLGKLSREKKGRSYKYYLAGTAIFDRKGGNWEADA